MNKAQLSGMRAYHKTMISSHLSSQKGTLVDTKPQQQVTRWKAVADSVLVRWDGVVPKLSTKILVPENSRRTEDVVELEVVAVGSVARADVRVGDRIRTRVEALRQVEGDVWQMSAGLILGIKRTEPE